jgi:ABC-type branched-subunit amino acid transport system substrate-binding protein
MLFFSAGNSGAQHALTSHPLHIQLKPKVDLMVDALTEALKRRNWKSVFVIYEATRQNEHALELLRSRFPEAGITMTGAGGFTGKVTQSDSKSRRVASVLHQLRDGNSSVIVMLTSPDFGGQLVRDLRSLGVLQQIVGFSSLDDDKYVGIAGEAGLGTLVTTSYQSDTYLAKRFEVAFRKRFPSVEADEEAAIGYDSVRLYADALSYSGSVNPQSVAATLNYKLPLWHGLLGSYRIEDGQVISLKYGLRKLQRGEEGKMRYVIVPKDPA